MSDNIQKYFIYKMSLFKNIQKFVNKRSAKILLL